MSKRDYSHDGKRPNSQYDKAHKLCILEGQLRYERESFMSHWSDLAEYILPRRIKKDIQDTNSGERKNTSIIDSTATMAARTLSSGLMTGITSPARTWFKLRTDNEELNEQQEVASYFEEVATRMRNVFLRSNLYNTLPTLYADIGTFGTGLLLLEEDLEDVVIFKCLPIASYFIANDKKGEVKTFFREFQMSVRQIVEKFGMKSPGDHKSIDWSNISEIVRNHWAHDEQETMINVNHMILANEEYRPNMIDARYKKYVSYYYEQGSSTSVSSQQNYVGSKPDKFLRESGYDYFPAFGVRWEVAGEDSYGTGSPGMIALGDVKQLQLGEKRIYEAIDQKIKPSMVGPTALRNVGTSILPGKITYFDEREGVKGFRRLFEVDFDIREMEAKQEQTRYRISKSYYEDLFLMLSTAGNRDLTATEVNERVQEKLLALGPVLERVNQDLLDPMIESTYMIMERRGMLPPIPEALEQMDYKIEYISVFAQAQKIGGVGGIERFLGFVGNLAQFDPQSVLKLNTEEIMQNYAEMLGIDPDSLRTKEEVAQIQAQMQAAQEAQARQERMANMAQTSKALSETEISEDNALGQILQQR